jgi:stage II sporulation protein R
MESTIALTLCLVLGYALFSQYSQNRLSNDLVRLRVVANSDSARDQQIKREVRDAVLEEIAAWGEAPSSAEEMMQCLQKHRAQLEQTVRRTLTACRSGDAFTIRLDWDYYPTREYGSFSLPAGNYQGLRIFLGEGAGHNWWCVIYPSLCLDAASAEEELSDEECGLIHQDTTEYAVRFRTAELLGELGALLS